MSNILVMGGASYDTIIRLEKNPSVKGTIYARDIYERCGCSGTVKAIALQKLGADVTFHALLGEDWEGQQIIRCLKDNQVNLLMDKDPAGTDRRFCLLDDDGDEILICLPKGQDPSVIDEARLTQAIAKADVVALNIAEYNKALLPLLEGKEVWTDLQDYQDRDPFCMPFIEASRVIFLSSERLTDYRTTMKKLAHGGRLIVATHAGKGSTAFFQDRFYEQSAHDFTLVDSTGAGDCYFSGFLVEYLKKQSLERSLMMASVCGGLSIETKDLVPKDLTYDMLVKTMIAKGIR